MISVSKKVAADASIFQAEHVHPSLTFTWSISRRKGDGSKVCCESADIHVASIIPADGDELSADWSLAVIDKHR